MRLRLLVPGALLALFVCCGCEGYVTEPLKAGSDIAVIADLRALHNAQTQFMMKNNRFGTLEELKDAGFIDAALAAGRKHKYVITLVSADERAYAFRADPDAKNKLSTRHFYLDQTGLVRACEGGPAGPDDPPATM